VKPAVAQTGMGAGLPPSTGTLAGGLVVVLASGGCVHTAQFWAIDRLDVQPDDGVLAVGFGPGLVFSSGAGRSHRACRRRRLLRRDGRANDGSQRAGYRVRSCRARPGSVERLPFDNNTFQKALAINSLQVWPDAMAGLREMRRVMKIAGIVMDAHVGDKDGDFCAVARKR